jgi:hypothetical protein
MDPDTDSALTKRQEGARQAAQTRRANRADALQRACEVARDWDVAPDDLLSVAAEIASAHTEQHREREEAKAAARDRTGLTARDLGRVENKGYDYTSGWLLPGKTGERLRDWDVYAAELAAEYPILGLGNPEAGDDLSAALWRVLREGRVSPPKASDPGILRQAAQYLVAARSSATGEVWVTAEAPPVLPAGQRPAAIPEPPIVRAQDRWDGPTADLAGAIDALLLWIAQPGPWDGLARRVTGWWLITGIILGIAWWWRVIKAVCLSDWEALAGKLRAELLPK